MREYNEPSGCGAAIWRCAQTMKSASESWYNRAIGKVGFAYDEKTKKESAECIRLGAIEASESAKNQGNVRLGLGRTHENA